jgi:ribosomal protein S18 acetylase RimI-like enzyme
VATARYERLGGVRSSKESVPSPGASVDLAVPGPLRDWRTARPGPSDAPALTDLLRRHEEHGRGWAAASEDDVLVEVSARGYLSRQHVVLRDPAGDIRAWASAHDRAAGRLVLSVLVDRLLADDLADLVAATLFEWAEEEALRVGAERGLDVQQVDSGAFADDARQHRWLARAGFEKVRTWWQMTRAVSGADTGAATGAGPGVRIRRVRRLGTGQPDEDDLRTVHDILESAFADHFNSHEETFDEFVSRLREDQGHRWDHWWIAELVDGAVEPAGALVGSVSEGDGHRPGGSYVEYIGVLQSARGRGVARSLLNTVIADAAANGRDRVGLEVDADSPTGADGLYVSMGWQTSYVTESWHRDVPVRRPSTPGAPGDQ